MFFKGSKKGTLLFEEAHGVGGLSERAGSSAGRTTARWSGRPKWAGRDRRRGFLAENLADTTGRWFGRPNRPAGPPPGGVGQIFGQNPRRWSWPDHRPVVRPAEPPPSFSAEDHRRASPPFHSDELGAMLVCTH